LCDDLKTKEACSQDKAGQFCFWLYTSDDDDDDNGICKSKSDEGLDCKDVTRLSQCTDEELSEIINLSDECEIYGSKGTNNERCDKKCSKFSGDKINECGTNNRGDDCILLLGNENTQEVSKCTNLV
jgi:hypothetical protein